MRTPCSAVTVAVLLCAALMSAHESGAQSPGIHGAASSGDISAVRALVEKDRGLARAKDAAGRTPLHAAAAAGRTPVVEYLLDSGADAGAADNTGHTALHLAAMGGRDEAVVLLIARRAPLEARSAEGQTPLASAAMVGAVGPVRRLLQAGANVEAANTRGRTPLLLAARESGSVEVARALLDHKANVDAQDTSGDTPLSLAAWRGYGPFVALLIERGAAVPTSGRKALELIGHAASKGLETLFGKLADGGVSLDVIDERQQTLLHGAAAGGSTAIVSKLLTSGAAVDKQDRDGWTPLHNAAFMGRTEVARALVDRGAKLDLRNALGQSAWNLAQEAGSAEIAAMLGAKGASTSAAEFPAIRGPYLGQTPPGAVPQEFAIGIVGGHFSVHSSVTFSPDGTEAYWSESIPPKGTGYSSGRTMVSRLVNGTWTAPARAMVGRVPMEDVPVVAADGKRVYDMARRALPGQPGGGEHIWVADRVGDGWGDPRPLSQAVNALPHHWQFWVDRDGAVTFSSSWKGTRGLFVSRLVDGKHVEPTPVEGLGAQTESDAMPFVAPDGRYLLFSRNYDIHVSFRGSDGKWTAAVPLPSSVNTRGMELCPTVSPDGRYLFFMRAWRVYWVEAGVIEEARTPSAGRP